MCKEKSSNSLLLLYLSVLLNRLDHKQPQPNQKLQNQPRPSSQVVRNNKKLGTRVADYIKKSKVSRKKTEGEKIIGLNLPTALTSVGLVNVHAEWIGD